MLMDGRLSKDFDVLKDMFSAVQQLHQREERGVGRQNFQYGNSLLEFSHIALSTSPQLYRTMRQTLKALPTERALKYVLISCQFSVLMAK